ncbi:hypothetical protein T484DRAFT_1975753 [Baffinella frigidus]|nr:hypothetical protein T484DRAFT_1975753 [Cryptophyta sp. CCMP2293]|mmetsp:Transcript_15863/g.38273  ORF Transcript_15863/g.38273 Transcript_15863/m.38273 type:complete len:180 (-) Transcript_15863:55-594(-)
MSDDGADDRDPRVAQLEEYMADHSPEEVAEFLISLGGKDGIIHGGIGSDENFAKAHFLVCATLDKGGKLTEEIKTNAAVFKACCNTPALKASLLLAIELLVVKEKRNGIKKYDAILRCLWEADVADEAIIEEWHSKERALQPLYPGWKSDDAVKARQAAYKFVEWVQAAEESGDSDPQE